MPFSTEQFFNIFEQYNLAVYPMQFVLNALALVCLVLIFFRGKHIGRIISTILAFLWLWMGIVYHIGFFSQINRAAYAFGGLFIIQGGLFLVVGTLRNKITLQIQPTWGRWVGAFFILYALLLYPLIGYFVGHVYPQSPTFGLPCPTTIFTLGLLLMASKSFPRYLIIVPVIWSFIGFTAVLSFGVWEDGMLLIAGLVSLIVVLSGDRQRHQPPLERKFTAV